MRKIVVNQFSGKLVNLVPPGFRLKSKNVPNGIAAAAGDIRTATQEALV